MVFRTEDKVLIMFRTEDKVLIMFRTEDKVLIMFRTEELIMFTTEDSFGVYYPNAISTLFIVIIFYNSIQNVNIPK